VLQGDPQDQQESILAAFDSFAANYQDLVNENVRITGESSDYFAAYKARYIARKVVCSQASRILDYGCGVGPLAGHLMRMVRGSRVDGFDVSKESIERVSEDLHRQGTFTTSLETLGPEYDVIVLSNVLHHVQPTDREGLVRQAGSRLAPGGKLVVFEHNPINPLTRWAVSQCVFDEDAILLPNGEARGYFQEGELRLVRLDYIVFFPRWLKWFRPFEPFLQWCPLGAQYAVVAQRVTSPSCDLEGGWVEQQSKMGIS
jgi:2-polyprenyl-3-methyl-5-hydroxy-6-metoxy-1,4-benzoquinol methylase